MTVGGKNDPSFAQVNWGWIKNFLSSSKSPKAPILVELVRIIFGHHSRKCGFAEEHDKYASGCSRRVSEECDSREWVKGVREWTSELHSVLAPTYTYTPDGSHRGWILSALLRPPPYSDKAMLLVLWDKGGPSTGSQVSTAFGVECFSDESAWKDVWKIHTNLKSRPQKERCQNLPPLLAGVIPSSRVFFLLLLFVWTINVNTVYL